MGTTTRTIAELLPAVRRGDRQAIDEVVSIAYERLVQLISAKKTIFIGAPMIAQRYYRGDEQTGHIISELYERLRKAVEGRKLSDLQHPAGFWKIAADHVMYILLDLARDRKKERGRQGPSGEKRFSDSDSSGAAAPVRDDGRRDGGMGGAVASPRHDSQYQEPVGRAWSPIEQVPDGQVDEVELHILRQDVIEAIGRLPEPHQSVLSMYYYLGATQREISQMLLPVEPDMYERKVGRIIVQAESMLRPMLAGHK